MKREWRLVICRCTQDMVVNNLPTRHVGFGRTGSLPIAGEARPICPGTEPFPLAHDITDMPLTALHQQLGSIALPAKLAPKQWAMMELRDRSDLPILQKCYSAYPPLSPEWLNFRRELHMTDDKDLFIEQQAPGLLPLFEGKMIWQYSHVFEKPQYWLNPAAFDERLKSKELHRMAQDLGVPKAEVAKHTDAIRSDREYLRLGYRKIASDTNERTLIFSLLPKNIGVGHKVTYTVPKRYVRGVDGSATTLAVSPLRMLFALAWFNSVLVDWLARFMIQISVSQTYLYRLPVPQPDDDTIRANPDYAQLAKNALLLSLSASWDYFCELAPLFDVQPADVPFTAKARDLLRADNDKTVARLYGITGGEFAHMLRSFIGMANKRPEYLMLLDSSQSGVDDTSPLA